MTELQKPIITKDTLSLLDDYYAHPSTSTLIFRFTPHPFVSTENRLSGSRIQRASIGGKDLYLVDGFFSSVEQEQMEIYSQRASFSRNSYGSPEAIQKGEKPALSMNGQERWRFFSSPPPAITEVYKLLSLLGEKLQADITTLPWELCDPSAHGSPAVIANKLEEASAVSQELGKHRDCHPEGKIAFGIPMLYGAEKVFYPSIFVSGCVGNPWLISVMVYTSDPNFAPEFCMGTVFYDEEEQISLRVNCSHMRLVLLKGILFIASKSQKSPQGLKLGAYPMFSSSL